MSQSNEKYQKGFLIFFIVTVIVVLVVVFILRATASKSGKYLTTLSSTEQQSQGYGTYKVVNTSPCFTANGKCSGTGTQIITEYCVANPDTGYGCIDENGEQTFAPRTTQQNCLPNCRATILQEQTNTYLNTCNYEAPYGDLTNSFTLLSGSPLYVSVTKTSVTKFSNGGLPPGSPGYAFTLEKYNDPFLTFQLPGSNTYPRNVLLTSTEGYQYGFIFLNGIITPSDAGKFYVSINGVAYVDPTPIPPSLLPNTLPTKYSYISGDNFGIKVINKVITFTQNATVLNIDTGLVNGTQFLTNFILYVNPDTIDQIAFGYSGSTALCIPKTAKTFNYKVFNCVVNDGVGENACNYACGSDGKNGANVSGDSIVESPSYIPACVGNYGRTITLNSLTGINLTALPKQGYKISKGYLVKNKLVGDNIVPNIFTIDPPYYPPPSETEPFSFGLTEITRDQLTTLDSSLIVYENCAMPTERVKPYCANYYYYQGTDVDSQITLIDKNVNADSTSNFIFSKDCFNNPFWNISGTKYRNPYNTDSTSVTKYSLIGIGGYGLTYENYVCQFTPGNLEQVPNTGTPIDTNPPQYYIPGALGGPNETNYCVPFTSSIVNPPTSNTNCYNKLENVTMPLTPNKIYNICDVTYPDGSHPNDWQANADGSAKIKTPGLIQVCQYLPQTKDLDFTNLDNATPFQNPLNTNLQQYFGNFTQLTLTNSGKTYFLGTRTSPCDSTVDSNYLSPMTNCSYVKPIGVNGYSIERAAFIYNGGSGTTSEAGNYWNKPGCDSEMIELTSSLNILFSLNNSPVISAPVGNTQTISGVNMYAYFGNIFGILLQYSGNSSLLFKPILQGDTEKSHYNPTPPGYNENFNLEFDYTNTNNITLKVLLPATNVDKFDGNVYTQNVFNISNTPMNTRVIPYNEYKKTSGLYDGQDVTVAAVFQRNFACYTTTCDPQTSVKPCFPKTCNLYYDYNADKC